MRPADEMEGPASDGETAQRCVPRRSSCSGQGDEAVRGAPGTFGDAAEVRHHHQTESDLAAGKVIAADRLGPAVDRADGEDGRLDRVDLPADDRLEVEDEQGRQ